MTTRLNFHGYKQFYRKLTLLGKMPVQIPQPNIKFYINREWINFLDISKYEKYISLTKTNKNNKKSKK